MEKKSNDRARISFYCTDEERDFIRMQSIIENVTIGEYIFSRLFPKFSSDMEIWI